MSKLFLHILLMILLIFLFMFSIKTYILHLLKAIGGWMIYYEETVGSCNITNEVMHFLDTLVWSMTNHCQKTASLGSLKVRDLSLWPEGCQYKTPA